MESLKTSRLNAGKPVNKVKLYIWFFLLSVCLLILEYPNLIYNKTDLLIFSVAMPLGAIILTVLIDTLTRLVYSTITKKDLNISCCVCAAIYFISLFCCVTSCADRVLNYYWLYNYWLVFAISTIFILIFKRIHISMIITGAFSTILSLTNLYLIRFRNVMFNWSDLKAIQTAANVAGEYDFTPGKDEHFVLSLVLFVILISIFFLRVKLSLNIKEYAVGIGIVLLIIIGLANADSAAASTFGYDNSGCLYKLLATRNSYSLDYPEGYDINKVEEIFDSIPEQDEPEGITPTNIISVMNESFSGMSYLNNIELNVFNSLSENVIKGTAYSSVYGGGTAVSEYEFLTGNSMATLDSYIVPYTSGLITPSTYSIVGQLNSLGYKTIAFHPFEASGWNRVATYERFGFDEQYFSDSDFIVEKYGECTRSFMSDRKDYEIIIDFYENKNKGEKFFIHNVTIQNHGPNPDYINTIQNSDEDIMYLLNYFKAVDEPTMIVFYGDHQLSIDNEIIAEHLGAKPSELSPEEQEQLYEVPFFIWTNYDIEEEDNIKTSLNYLSTMMFETANLPLSKYQIFIKELREKLPVIHMNGYWINDEYYEKMEDLPEDVRELVEEYKLIHYYMLLDAEKHPIKQY